MVDLAEPIILLASIFGVFLWLRNDIKNSREEVRSDMQQFRAEMRGDMQQFREEVHRDFQRLEGKVDGLDSRLRAVESEQSRVAELLEGLGLAGVLPTRDD
ncbi:MAG: hypothetical protein J4G18_14175 [Anaerolineae bacterium]|nr:hypothetical protein [Anaerolineae bacterium]